MSEKKLTESELLAILCKRIEQLLNRKSLMLQYSLTTLREVSIFQLFGKEDYDRIKQMLWDEYQHHLEPIDSLHATAYILQQKIKQTTWKKS